MRYPGRNFKLMGTIMRGLREGQGLSVWDLAFKSNVSEIDIWRLEHGLFMEHYHMRQFFALCEALDVEPYVVLRLSGKKREKA